MNKTIQLSNGLLTATISTLGAELISLKRNDREYMWQADPKYWPKHSPVLFPIVGTLKNNSYLYNGQIHAMNRHGFAREQLFSIANQGQDSAVFTLTSDGDTRVMYPFDFVLEITYTLQESALLINYVVRNNGNAAMPFSLGAHPAFALPGTFANYSLRFEKDEPLESRKLVDGLITDNTTTHETVSGHLPLDYGLFEQDALVFTSLQSRSVELLEKSKALLAVRFDKFPHLGIWTKKNAPFICIEPWQGYADKFDHTDNITEKDGILKLDPGMRYDASVEIQIVN